MAAQQKGLKEEELVKALQKIGPKYDREKFIDALEGMVIDKSPVGRLELRVCDHQLLLPTYAGITKKVPQYKDFLIGTDIQTVSPQDGAPTCEDVKKLRAAYK